ncbi:hypothetical protein VULLAG_LOCUS18809 [Vulpes lagopus]
MLRAGGQAPKSTHFTGIFLLYEVRSLVAVENLSSQAPHSVCPILKEKVGMLGGPSTLVFRAWPQPGTQPGPARACPGHTARSGPAPESRASPHKSSRCCKEGFQRAWSSAEDGQPANRPGGRVRPRQPYLLPRILSSVILSQVVNA